MLETRNSYCLCRDSNLGTSQFRSINWIAYRTAFVVSLPSASANVTECRGECMISIRGSYRIRGKVKDTLCTKQLMLLIGALKNLGIPTAQVTFWISTGVSWEYGLVECDAVSLRRMLLSVLKMKADLTGFLAYLYKIFKSSKGCQSFMVFICLSSRSPECAAHPCT